MNEFDVPIFKKSYDLYKEFYICLKTFPKQDRYSLGQKSETVLTDILECLLTATGLPKAEKLPYLDKASGKLNILRIYMRLAKDIKAMDNKRYVFFQDSVDEIGRMLGGWKKSVQVLQQPDLPLKR